jgi:hypothetical protein
VCFFKVNVLTMVMNVSSTMFVSSNLSIDGTTCFLASSVHFFDNVHFSEANGQWQFLFL